MLTHDLLRARIKKGVICPQYLEVDDPGWVGLAEELVSLFQLHQGRPYGELREALKELLGDDPGPETEVGRGLIKLLEDSAELALDSALDPKEVRRALFTAAAPHLPLKDERGAQRSLPGVRLSRQALLEEVASRMKTTAEALEQALYADLPDARVVKEVRISDPGWLLRRYNVALAQAVLLRALWVEIELKAGAGRYRQLFRWVRFFRLLHTVEALPQGGWKIRLDGPLSLFKQSSKYGLQLAELLPALLLADQWTLQAEVKWGHRDELKRFVLSPRQGLVSHYPDQGVFSTREEKWLVERFAGLKTEWRLSPAEALLDLGGQALIMPDFRLEHPDGREAWLEILGFWRRGWLERRLELYREHGPGNLILAVSKQLQGSAEGLEGFAGAIHVFREAISPKEVVALAEAVGKRAGGLG